MAEFLTVNLKNLLQSQRSYADLDPIEQKEKATARQDRDLSKISDWAKELKDRLAENNALESSERQSDYEVESQFFEDYFHNANKWDAACAEQLISLGDPLKKAIKVLGFKRSANPILGFITNSYVITKLIKTKLLNVNTFKAIYDAVSKKLVVDSEFFTSNDYNIIYCQDLYRRTAAEMLEYLKIQKTVLDPSASTYTKADQERNKRIFFYIKTIKELDPEKRAKEIKALPLTTAFTPANQAGTKLNSMEVVNKLSGTRTDAPSTNGASGKATSASALAKKVGNNNAQALAAIQYLSATTEVPEAKAALKHMAFKNVSMEAFIEVSAAVTKTMKEADLPDTEVKSFIALLLGRLERTI